MYPKHFFEMFRPNIQTDMVFVGMSFETEEEFRWRDIIRPAIADAGMDGYKADARLFSDSINIDIMQGINNAKILLFDISSETDGNLNGNVMYELGLAHAVRLPEEVLVIRSTEEDLLFDVGNLRVHQYSTQDLQTARHQVALLIAGSVASIESTKRLVIEKAISLLDEVCLVMIRNHSTQESFSLTVPNAAFEPETIEKRSSIRRMMDLGLLALVWRKTDSAYAYSWTPAGRAVANYLGFPGPE